MSKSYKPVIDITGCGGNISLIANMAGMELKRLNMAKKASKMDKELLQAMSYEEALNIICNYVELQQALEVMGSYYGK